MFKVAIFCSPVSLRLRISNFLCIRVLAAVIFLRVSDFYDTYTSFNYRRVDASVCLFLLFGLFCSFYHHLFIFPAHALIRRPRCFELSARRIQTTNDGFINSPTSAHCESAKAPPSAPRLAREAVETLRGRCFLSGPNMPGFAPGCGTYEAPFWQFFV